MKPEIDQQQKQITAILRQGLGRALLDRLFESGLLSASLHRARGVGITPVLGSRGLGTTIEWEILTVLVPKPDADLWFRFIFMSDVSFASHLALPDVSQGTESG